MAHGLCHGSHLKKEVPGVSYPNIRFAHRCQCGQYKSIATPPQYGLCLFFTLLCFTPITSHVVMGTKGQIPCQVACAKGLVACYISPSTHNMGKTWTQNMSRNAKVKKNGAKMGQTGGKRIVGILLYINN